ncbi:MAG: sigma-70 family RNA polymerase sigma factor [Planctomycetes bacterium]|nr:sigma-70 family RNA polymerase sigma factor [Planctomycetota bacterium]
MAPEPRAADTERPPARDFAAGLVERHRPALARYLRVLGARPDELDDLLQEAFVVLLDREFVFAGDGQARTFLRATARNLFLRRHRDQLPQVEAAELVWDRRCGDDDGDGYVDALRQCLQALPARSRTLVLECHEPDAVRGEVAQRFGLSVEGVKTALRRLRATLRQCIERRLA